MTWPLKAQWRRRVRGDYLRARAGLFMIRHVACGDTRSVGSLHIFGSRPFCERLEAAALLLRERASKDFVLLERHIDLVIMAPRTASAVRVCERPAVVWFGECCIAESNESLAAALVHESAHCELYWSHRDAHPDEAVPRHVYSGKTAEAHALGHQLRVLEQVGGSEQELSSLRTAMRTEWWLTPWEDRTV